MGVSVGGGVAVGGMGVLVAVGWLASWKPLLLSVAVGWLAVSLLLVLGTAVAGVMGALLQAVSSAETSERVIDIEWVVMVIGSPTLS
jgi:hypothetical protein